MKRFNVYPGTIGREVAVTAMGLLATASLVAACEQSGTQPAVSSPQHKDTYGEGTLGTVTNHPPLYEQAKSCHATAIRAWLADAQQLPPSQAAVITSPAHQEGLAIKHVYQDGEDGYLLEVTETVAGDSSIGRLELRGVVLDQEHIPPVAGSDEYLLPLQSNTYHDTYTVTASAVVRMETGKTPQEMFVVQPDEQVTFDDVSTGVVRQEDSVTLQDIARQVAAGEADSAVVTHCETMQSLMERLDA